MPSHRKFYGTIMIGILALLAGYVALWFVQMNRFAANIESLGKPGSAAVDIRWTSLERGGFPYRLAIVLRDPEVRLFAPRPFVFRAPSVEIIAQPWDTGHAILLSDKVEGTLAGATMRAGLLRASLVTSGNSLDHFEIQLNGVDLTRKGRTMTVRGLLLAGRHLPVPAIKDAGSGNSLTLPRRGELVLRADAARISGSKTPLDGFFLRAGLNGMSIPGWSATSLKSWRSSGGTVTLSPMILSSQGIELNGEGTLALDASLHPEGALSFKGPEPELIRWAGILFALDEKAKAEISATLASNRAAMKRPAPLPVSIEGGRMRAGSLELMRFQSLMTEGTP